MRVVLDNISYVISTISIVLDPSTELPHEVWSHRPIYHGGRSSVPFDIPTQLGLIHQIYASQLWEPYSRSLKSPKGSGKDEGSHNGKNEKYEGGTHVADPCCASKFLEIGW
jgi:hypothetical protein